MRNHLRPEPELRQVMMYMIYIVSVDNEQLLTNPQTQNTLHHKLFYQELHFLCVCVYMCTV